MSEADGLTSLRRVLSVSVQGDRRAFGLPTVACVARPGASYPAQFPENPCRAMWWYLQQRVLDRIVRAGDSR